MKNHVKIALALAIVLLSSGGVIADGTLVFQVKNESGQPMPARVHLRDDAGRAVESLGMTDRIDHLAVDGEQTFSVPMGTYVYGIERSPEWEQATGEITVQTGETETVAVSLQRIVDLQALGWYAGDLHIHRDLEDIELLMRTSDLHIGPVITWWNDRNHWHRTGPAQPLVQFDDNRFTHLVAGEDEREGGALLYFGTNEPIDITGADREFPSPLTFLQRAREQSPDLHLDIEKPFWWDVPVWLALAQPDTIGLANNHMCRDRMYEDEAWGRPRDTRRLPPPRGNGFWTQEIYYHILNAGFRLPPSAGSASGVLPNPVGYNRVYVQVDGELTWEKWWTGLRSGRSFVTNGPLLIATAASDRPGANREYRPGKELQFEQSGPQRIVVQTQLWKTDTVPQLELIHNGDIVATDDCSDAVHETFRLQTTCESSGWFLVRAITDNPRTFRFASSAPFYVEFDDKPRISRTSCRFFLEWVRERIQRVSENVDDPDKREAVLSYHRKAEDFWMQRLAEANAE